MTAVALCVGPFAHAQDPPPVPDAHWSGLPLWGSQAAARGYQIPPPFGIGATVYSARQPVDLHDLQLGRAGNPPVSVTEFLQIDRVDTSQQNVSMRFDVLVLPFLDVYAIAGYTSGTTKGVIQVPATPAMGLEARQLRLNASFDGPTYGWGLTLQGGTRLRESPELLVFAVADINQTRTDLAFANEQLLAETKPTATVFAARLGMVGMATPGIKASVWLGAMYQKIQQEVAGSVADTTLEFVVIQSAVQPWNALLGGLFELGNNVSILVEGGAGPRRSILVGLGYRF